MNDYSILMVDDDPYVLSSLGRRFEKKGYQIKTVDNAEAAFDLLKRNAFDLVITDLVMEETGGLEVLKKAKALHPEIMVIILTGFGEMDSEHDAFRLGADDYLLKLSDPSKIYRRVAACLERLEFQRKIKAQSEELEKVNQELQEEMEIRKQKENEQSQTQDKLKERFDDRSENPDEPDIA